MEKSHRIFMAYLFIRFQHKSFLMSTKYLQYLLKILSVTLSAQICPVTPTIPGNTEKFQTCVALLSHCCRSCFESKLVPRLLFLQAIPDKRGGHKKSLFCPNPSVSQVRARMRFMSRVKSTESSMYVEICGLNFRPAFVGILTLQCTLG